MNMFWINSTISLLLLFLMKVRAREAPCPSLSGGSWQLAFVGSFPVGGARFPTDFVSSMSVCSVAHLGPKSSPKSGVRTSQIYFWTHVWCCCYLLYFRAISTSPKRWKSDRKSVKKTVLLLDRTGCTFWMILTSNLEPKRWGHSRHFALGILRWQQLHSALNFGCQNHNVEVLPGL